LTFSFARAIQLPALPIWHGEEANVAKAQQALSHRARCSAAARRGEYSEAEDGPLDRLEVNSQTVQTRATIQTTSSSHPHALASKPVEPFVNAAAPRRRWM
jgi:hypothetical protein